MAERLGETNDGGCQLDGQIRNVCVCVCLCVYVCASVFVHVRLHLQQNSFNYLHKKKSNEAIHL